MFHELEKLHMKHEMAVQCSNWTSFYSLDMTHCVYWLIEVSGVPGGYRFVEYANNANLFLLRHKHKFPQLLCVPSYHNC